MKKNKIWIGVLVLLVVAAIVFAVTRKNDPAPAQEQPTAEDSAQKEEAAPSASETNKTEPDPAAQEPSATPEPETEPEEPSPIEVEEDGEAVIEVPEGEASGGL